MCMKSNMMMMGHDVQCAGHDRGITRHCTHDISSSSRSSSTNSSSTYRSSSSLPQQTHLLVRTAQLSRATHNNHTNLNHNQPTIIKSNASTRAHDASISGWRRARSHIRRHCHKPAALASGGGCRVRCAGTGGGSRTRSGKQDACARKHYTRRVCSGRSPEALPRALEALFGRERVDAHGSTCARIMRRNLARKKRERKQPET